ncbi:MAG TPA: AbrB/MazE/SpoVT family DNA-binding domain-containing protein [Kiritimatiellia bacterium]|nr:AbrB/MazE/SpoVT family DNA-binding domain-containing protein [Kiritimatiellia bacterium]
MATTVTGKNQVTIPAAIASAYGLKPGSMLEWLPGNHPEEIRCRVLPEPGKLAYTLKGSGRKYLKKGRPHPLKALQQERSSDESATRKKSL